MADKAVVSEIFPGMPLRNYGITIRVNNPDGTLMGYVVINKAYVRWYKGKLSKNKKPCREIRTDDFSDSD